MMKKRNKNLSGLKEHRFSREWDTVRLRVLWGLKKLGHDIPIVSYTTADLVREMTKKKRSAGIRLKK